MAEMIFSKVDCAIKFALLGTAVLALGTEQRRGRRDGRGLRLTQCLSLRWGISRLRRRISRPVC